MSEQLNKTALTDGSRLIIESLAETGADVFAGYPITPANLLYAYAKERIPLFFPASDEISALQLISGFAASGKLGVTASSFPGFALMLESINMAYMMELPMVIVLVQRLGPSTGSATTGAQGDLLLLRGCISGAYPLPVLCPSNLNDCWLLAHQALSIAVKLRTPVVLLTSKEMIMTSRSFDISSLPTVGKLKREYYHENSTYQPYKANAHLVPPFLPLGNNTHQVRINSSTHDAEGFIKKTTPDALANTIRLKEKMEKRISEYLFYDLDKEDNDKLIVTYGISSEAARDAVKILRKNGQKVSLLIIKTLLPVSAEIIEKIQSFHQVFIVEENVSGQLKELLFGNAAINNIKCINKIGNMIHPNEIVHSITN